MGVHRPYTEPGVTVEYGLRLNCAKQGCAEPHSDNGEVILTGRGREDTWQNGRINGHACDRVTRTITASNWGEVS